MSIDNPAALLVNISGSMLSVTASVLIPSGTNGIIAAGVGSDGIVRYHFIDSNNALKVTGSFTVTPSGVQSVTGSVTVNQPVQVTGSIIVTTTGSIAVTGSVNITNSVLTVTGTILALPTGTQTITGTVTINQPVTVTGSVGLDRGNSAANPLFVTGTFILSGSVVQQVTGTVLALPTGVQQVTGTVSLTGVVSLGSPSGSVSALSFGDITLSAVVTSAVRRTTYTEQTVNFTGSIVSSAAADASVSTGARKVLITYLDSTGVGPLTESLTLNGTTAVNLSGTNHCFIEKMEVTSVGSGGKNAGTISLFTGITGSGTTVGTIAVGDNQTFWCHHYTPLGKTTNIAGVIIANNSSITGGGCTFVVKTQTLGVSDSVEKQVSDILTLFGQSSMTERLFTIAIPLAVGPARVLMYTTTSSSTAIVYRASFDYYDV